MQNNLMKIFLIFLLLTNVSFGGGSTIVGDGGYVADCKRKAYFIDRLEYLVKNDWNDLPGKYYTGNFRKDLIRIVAAIAKDFSLSLKEKEELSRAVKNVVFLQYYNRNPYAGVTSLQSVELYLKTHTVKLDKRVASFIQNNKCELVPIATKITKAEAIEFEMEEACIEFSKKNCLVVDRIMFKELSNKDQQCLVTHELLRLVPKSFQSEEELRSLTMKYCSL